MFFFSVKIVFACLQKFSLFRCEFNSSMFMFFHCNGNWNWSRDEIQLWKCHLECSFEFPFANWFYQLYSSGWYGFHINILIEVSFFHGSTRIIFPLRFTITSLYCITVTYRHWCVYSFSELSTFFLLREEEPSYK